MSKRKIAYAKKACIDPEEEGESLPFEPREIVIHTDHWFDCDYTVSEVVLGRGKFGEVKKCTETRTGLTLAAKIVNTRKEKDREDVRKEISIMTQLRHPKVLQIYDAYESKRKMCIITELVEGGELFDRIVDPEFDLTERVAILFMRQIVDGIAFIHSRNVLHLDLKPENIICMASTGTRIKIIDFGLAVRYDSFSSVKVMAGTVDFMAPEVCNYEDVSPATDMWSVGVICYVLVSGLSPFCGDDDAETVCNILRVEFDFAAEEFDEITAGCKDFIKKLLLKDTRKRLSAQECLRHSWLNKITRSQTKKHLSKKHHIRFFIRKKWKKAIKAVIAMVRIKNYAAIKMAALESEPSSNEVVDNSTATKSRDWRVNLGRPRRGLTDVRLTNIARRSRVKGGATTALVSNLSGSSGYESSGSTKSSVNLEDMDSEQPLAAGNSLVADLHTGSEGEEYRAIADLGGGDDDDETEGNGDTTPRPSAAEPEALADDLLEAYESEQVEQTYVGGASEVENLLTSNSIIDQPDSITNTVEEQQDSPPPTPPCKGYESGLIDINAETEAVIPKQEGKKGGSRCASLTSTVSDTSIGSLKASSTSDSTGEDDEDAASWEGSHQYLASDTIDDIVSHLTSRNNSTNSSQSLSDQGQRHEEQAPHHDEGAQRHEEAQHHHKGAQHPDEDSIHSVSPMDEQQRKPRAISRTSSREISSRHGSSSRRSSNAAMAAYPAIRQSSIDRLKSASPRQQRHGSTFSRNSSNDSLQSHSSDRAERSMDDPGNHSANRTWSPKISPSPVREINTLEKRQARIAAICGDEYLPPLPSYLQERTIPIQVEPKADFSTRRPPEAAFYRQTSGSDSYIGQSARQTQPIRGRVSHSPIRSNYQDTNTLQQSATELPVNSMDRRRARIAAIIGSREHGAEPSADTLRQRPPNVNSKPTSQRTSRTLSDEARHKRIAAILSKNDDCDI